MAKFITSFVVLTVVLGSGTAAATSENYAYFHYQVGIRNALLNADLAHLKNVSLTAKTEWQQR